MESGGGFMMEKQDPGAMGRDDGEGADPGPEDTFALVGNEIRTAVLRTLGDARDPAAAPAVLPFADLRERIDEDLDSGQFNYHLQRLVGEFVERTDEGYRLRPAGTALYRAIRAETFSRNVRLAPFEVGLECYFCGTAVTARYETGTFRIECPGCEYRYLASTRVPPSGVEDTDALLSRIDRYDRHQLLAFGNGVCPTCANDLTRRLLEATAVPVADADRDEVVVYHTCDRCGNQDYRTVGEALLYRPEVICFFADRGVDVTTVPVWELEFAATDRRLAVRATDPWDLRLRLECGDESRELAVDGDLAVR
jgi:hypothetical protein